MKFKLTTTLKYHLKTTASKLENLGFIFMDREPIADAEYVYPKHISDYKPIIEISSLEELIQLNMNYGELTINGLLITINTDKNYRIV